MKLAIVDNHGMFMSGLVYSLEKFPEVEKVYSFYPEEFSEVIECIENNILDLIIIDINLGDKNGFDFASELKKVNNKVLLAFVTGHGNQLNLRNQAKTFGADGFFLKDPKPEKFLLQIKKALSGKKPGIELELKLPRLTSREEKVLHYLCRGYSNQELAERFFVSSRQIERHKRNLTIKFNVSNDKTLVRKAIDLGYEIIY